MAGPAHGADLRLASQKAKANHEKALAEAKASRQRILDDRTALKSEVAKAKAAVAAMRSEIAQLNATLKALEVQDQQATKTDSENELDLREYTGVVRESARDLESLLAQSHFSAFLPERLAQLTGVLSDGRFPGMVEISTLGDLFMQEIALCGEVDRRTASFVAADGSESIGDILTIGPFSAVFRSDGDVGYLTYGESSQRFLALSKTPAWLVRRNLDQYMDGESEKVTFDFSRGAALRQLTQRSTFLDKITRGGPIVWPILAIGIIALAIAIERTLFLNRVHANMDRLMGRVNELAGRGDWAGCEDVLRHHEGKPVNNVLRAGLGAVNEKRETLESVLQEAILKELPRLERLLPVLNIMGAVAPLMGLLGTVTGMIDTFQSITLHGAGDPRMMSGGISEALITTMLGLSVAIPIMLVHTFLRRRLEHIIGDMEEKAVALSNIICRECTVVALVETPDAKSPSMALQQAQA
jgi:biopolymer transport protein ExbB